MTERQIRLFGDPVLRSASDPITVKPGDAKLLALAEDLVDSVKLPGRAGVAAPQIGVGLRAFSYNVDGEVGHLVNPTLELSQEQQDGLEGCLSIPDQYADVTRPAEVRMRWLGLDGKTHEEDFDGLWATCAQHELDHLNGILFIDHLSAIKRQMITRKMVKLKRERARG